MRAYIISVACASIVYSILSGLTPKGSAGKIMGLLCNLFLVLTVIQPFVHIKIPELQGLDTYRYEADAAKERGLRLSHEEEAKIIKQNMETYIQNKASKIGASIQTDIQLKYENGFYPDRIVITGEYTPAQRNEIENYLKNDLSIAEENQKWIGNG